MRKVVILSLALMVATAIIGLLVISAPFGKIRDLDARYSTTTRGITLEQVETIMGDAGRQIDSRSIARWDDQSLGKSEDDRIVSAIRYTVKTFFLPVTFEFTFDSENRLVGRHRYD